VKRRVFIKKSFLYTAGLSIPSVLLNCSKDEKPEPQPVKKKVLILGAGIAGLSAAYFLKNKGFEMTILEASTRVGGRINSINFEGYTADIGASWIHGIHLNPLYDLANNNAVLTTQTHYNPSYIFDTDGTTITESEWLTIEPYLDQLTDIAYQNQELSLEGILEIIAPQLSLDDRLTRLFYGAVRSEIEIPYAVDAKDISARALLVNDSFSGEDVIFPKGMQQLTSILAKDISVIFNTFVSKIDYSQKTIKVFTQEYTNVSEDRSCTACHSNITASSLNSNKIYDADLLIVALPLEMLKRRNVVFTPALSLEKKKALNGLEMGTMNKVFLKFETCFWNQDAYFLEYLKSDYSHVIEFFNPTAVGAENILVAVLSGYHAKLIESISETEIINMIMIDLRGMYGNSIPFPIAIHRTAWHTNPLSLGSYPHLKPGNKITVCDTIAAPIENRIFFAGDSTSKQYMATAHGAFISGKDAAERILNLNL